jgi:hypothetical protein
MSRHAMLVTTLVVAQMWLAACASSTSDTWTKPGVSEQQRGRDTRDCLNDARRVTSGPGGPVEQINQDRYRRCMTERGYTSGPAK